MNNENKFTSTPALRICAEYTMLENRKRINSVLRLATLIAIAASVIQISVHMFILVSYYLFASYYNVYVTMQMLTGFLILGTYILIWISVESRIAEVRYDAQMLDMEV